MIAVEELTSALSMLCRSSERFIAAEALILLLKGEALGKMVPVEEGVLRPEALTGKKSWSRRRATDKLVIDKQPFNYGMRSSLPNAFCFTLMTRVPSGSTDTSLLKLLSFPLQSG